MLHSWWQFINKFNLCACSKSEAVCGQHTNTHWLTHKHTPTPTPTLVWFIMVQSAASYFVCSPTRCLFSSTRRAALPCHWFLSPWVWHHLCLSSGSLNPPDLSCDDWDKSGGCRGSSSGNEVGQGTAVPLHRHTHHCPHLHHTQGKHPSERVEGAHMITDKRQHMLYQWWGDLEWDK